ncbi:MAG: esterase [Pseudomonadales bacterium]
MVLPGFTAGDESTAILRRYLKRLGYQPLPWGLGQNTGRVELLDRLTDHFASVAGEHDRRISLVGQSLGGVYARELARRFAGQVRQVITLGSPFSSHGADSTNALVGRLFQYMSGMSPDEMRDQMLNFTPQAPPVPSTAIYSKADGVVHWSTCLEYSGEYSENIEVLGSHSGMALNPLVFHALADRLAQPEGAWKPFQRNTGCRAMVYPRPERTLTSPETARANGGSAACAN